jgi:hypothetical protein
MMSSRFSRRDLILLDTAASINERPEAELSRWRGG